MGNSCCLYDHEIDALELCNAHRTIYEQDKGLTAYYPRYQDIPDKYRVKRYRFSPNSFTVNFELLRQDIRRLKVQAKSVAVFREKYAKDWQTFVGNSEAEFYKCESLWDHEQDDLNYAKIEAILQVEKESRPSGEMRGTHAHLVTQIKSLPSLCRCGACVGCKIQSCPDNVWNAGGHFTLYSPEKLRYELALRQANQDRQDAPKLRAELQEFQKYGFYRRLDVNALSVKELRAALTEASNRRDHLAVMSFGPDPSTAATPSPTTAPTPSTSQTPSTATLSATPSPTVTPSPSASTAPSPSTATPDPGALGQSSGTPAPCPYMVGSTIRVRHGSTFEDALVLETRPYEIKIHFFGQTILWDQWIGFYSDRIQDAPVRPNDGTYLMVRDTVGKVCEAVIMDKTFDNKIIKIHYVGFSDRWDEWIACDSGRIVCRL